MTLTTRSTKTRSRVLPVVSGLVALAMMGSVLPWLPMDIMTVIVTILGWFTGGTDVLGVNLGWATGVRLVAFVAGTALALTSYRRWRRLAGRCPRCGRHEGSESGDAGTANSRWQRFSVAAGYFSVALALPYAALKTAWGLGSDFALTDPDAFVGVSLWSPGFGDTALMAGIGILLGVGFARTWSPPRLGRLRMLRWMPLTAAAVGCAMLIPVGFVGTAGALRWLITGIAPGTIEGVEPWVFQWIYVLFLAWGLTLAAAAVGWHYRTLGACPACQA